MSVVSLLGVKVLNNPAPFNAPYEFEITFECLEQLREGRLQQINSCALTRVLIKAITNRSRMEADLRWVGDLVSVLLKPIP